LKKEIYLRKLFDLKKQMMKIENTPYTMWVKVVVLTTINMKYEKIAFNNTINEHPYVLVKKIIENAQILFNNLLDINFIENSDIEVNNIKSKIREKKHHELFNEMWNRYDDFDFQRYIERYEYRIKINDINDLIYYKSCVDLGAGNGAFCFALLKSGSKKVVGIDFGKKSIEYAAIKAQELGFTTNQALFKVASCYETGCGPNSFDFAIQNGVFHHLDDEDRAIKEAVRILNPGGWFWYYTEGEGGISYDLWDASVEMLQDVSVLFIENVLLSMNVSRNKIIHLTDGLSATYRHTSWDKITKKLESHGFGNFRRLKGGFDTDFDFDRIESDPYGKEKFGEGDLRVLTQLIHKK